jgi:ubiquinone/menaquinone biosynthesis C-methylase UbiE
MTDPEIVRYYESFDEHSRLTKSHGQLEFARSMDVFERHLPPPPARVLDIGGATGPYSRALADRGYEVHLLDLMPRHVEAARTRSGIASSIAGDARCLPWPDNLADAVLLMGPLYHLCTAEDRLQALREARRVAKPGGIVVAAAISRFASLLDGLHRGLIDDPRFPPIIRQDLETGNHRNPTGTVDFFTTAYFHRPEDLADEMESAGLRDTELFAVEGPVWIAPDFEQRWSDATKRTLLLDLVRKVEQEPALLGMSLHLLAISRR